MVLTTVHIPREKVRFLRIFHATQIVQEPVTTIRIQRNRTRVSRIIHPARNTQRYSFAATSMASSMLSGIATEQEASFPSPTYLRKRYKKLQRCKISHKTISERPTPGSTSYENVDPSFHAMRALNGQPGTKPEPVVVHAIIKDVKRGAAEKGESDPSATLGQMPSRSRLLASAQYASHSFSSRVNRLVQALGQGQHIRFAPTDRNGRADVFATAAVLSGATSESWITEESTVGQGDSGRSLSRWSRSPFPTLSLSSGGSFPHRNSEIQDTRSVGSPIISENQHEQLADRIRDEIRGFATTNQRDYLETMVGHERPTGVDPRVLRTHGRDGIETHIISPIPLDYQRRRGSKTPSIDSSGSGYLSSPLSQILTRQDRKEKSPAYSTRSNRSAIATAEENLWSPEIAPSRGSQAQVVECQPRKGRADRVERQENNSRINRWLKEALDSKKEPSAKKTGKAIGVFKDRPSSWSDEWAAKSIARPDKVLKDLTNVRHPGYLDKNSFAQEKEMQTKAITRAYIQSQIRPEPAVVPVYPSARSYLSANWAQAELKHRSAGRAVIASAQTALQGHVVADSPAVMRLRSRTSSGASTVRPARADEDLHPDVALALARLEGRAPPPATSPIQRWRDDTDRYGVDVEVELERLRMDAPEPLTPFGYGAWAERFEDAVDAGFDCALEAPLSPGARRYIDALV